MKTQDILDALIAMADDKIWATELALFSGDRRADFWTLEPAASQQFRATAYEIKVSRHDYKRDNDEKQGGALKFSDRFFYVTPPGLIQKADLPSWAGLLEWDGTNFQVKRKAPRRTKAEPDWEFIVSLLRNSGDVRRDTGLLKAQLAFHEHEAKRRQQWKKMGERRSWERFLRRTGHPVAAAE